jgi:2-polyprenyl-6-methoxyphenol hydroxylase-like FAD-dependent oxidoreductase
VADRRFTAVRDPAVFEAVVRTVPQLAPWCDVLEPVGPVHPMGGLSNTLRRLEHEGRPVVAGFAAVGDSVCTTNPTFGRGLCLALLGAADLVAAIDEDADDAEALAARLAAGVRAQIAPYYVDQARNDAARLDQLRSVVLGAPAPVPVAQPDRVSLGELRAASGLDPQALRSFWEVMGMLRLPDEVYGDPEVVARTRSLLRESPPVRVPQPDRARLAAALSGTG